MQNLLIEFINYFIFIIDVIAVIIILVGVVKSLIYFIDGKKSTNPGYVIGKALDLGLRYLMVGEVLSSVTTHKAEDLYALGILLAIRIVIVFVNQKEMEHELKQDIDEQELWNARCAEIYPEIGKSKEV